MRGSLFILASVLIASVPMAHAESRTGHGAIAGATLWIVWGVAGAQADKDTGVGVRYWNNATGSDPVVVYLTICARLDSGRGYCERTKLQA